MEIFNLADMNSVDKVSSLGSYHKYWLEYRQVRNNEFDNFSSSILNLKKKENSAINYFFTRVNAILLDKQMVICYIPSTTKENVDTGIRILAQKLVSVSRADGTSCICRHTSIPKSATGGDRSIEKHLASLHIVKPELVQDKIVLLMDDVTTTNNSMNACKKLLLEAGAKAVFCLALGQTVME